MTPEQEQALSVLMRRTQQGDRTAYESLLLEVCALVRGFVRRRVGDVPWIDDVTQEVLVAIHRSRHTWRPDRPFVPWFYAVAQSRLIDAIRRERRTRRHETPNADVLEATPERDAANAILAARDVGAALERLAPVPRRVIELLKIEERSIKDVARALALSEGNVRVIAHRAIKHLRNLLVTARDRAL
jgi:RNA polymerase sigma-70 factor (ECF subfamily)